MNNPQSPQLAALRRLEEIEHLQSLICQQMESKGYSSHDVFSVRLALDESVTNAILHGNCQDPSKNVQIAYHVDEDQVWLQVEDEGQGFCVVDVPDPTDPDLIDRPGGRGLFVMNCFMSSVEYNQRGNQVTMYKHRSDIPVEGIAGV